MPVSVGPGIIFYAWAHWRSARETPCFNVASERHKNATAPNLYQPNAILCAAVPCSQFVGRFMTYSFFKLIHLLALFVWIGGMFFSHFFLRKPLATLPAAQRFAFVQHVMRRFFNAVSVSVVLVLLTGLWMIGRTAKQMSRAGLSFEAPWSWTAMSVLGVVMILVFVRIRLGPYRRLSRAVKREDWNNAGVALASIRQWIVANIVLGVLVIAIGVMG